MEGEKWSFSPNGPNDAETVKFHRSDEVAASNVMVFLESIKDGEDEPQY